MAYQSITVIGNLGQNPDLRYTPSGVPVANFSLAVNRTWNDANGNKQEKTLWLKISCWRKQAELASQYLEKGRQVMVIGELEEPELWTDKSGTQRVSLIVTAQKIVFLGGKPGNGGDSTQPAVPHDGTPDATDLDDPRIPF